MRIAYLVFALAGALGAQPRIDLRLDGARFGLNNQPVKNLAPASCLEKPGPFVEGCPPNFDCQRTASFRIATTGYGLGPQDLRRFYVVPLARPEDMRCWAADLVFNDTNNYSAVGLAPFTITAGGKSENGELPIYIEGSAPALTLAEGCPSWPVGLGSSGSCKVTLQWTHAAHAGDITGCEWADDFHTLSALEGCPASAVPPEWTRLTRSRRATLTLAARIPWNQWTKAFAVPLREQPQSLRLKVRYRLLEGGPTASQEFPISYQIAMQWYLLLGCLLSGTVAGAALPLTASFARRQPLQLACWRRNTLALLIYGVAAWLLLYLTESRVGFLQTELRLNQAIPVLLFGLLIGFRGLGFVIDWVEKLLTPSASRIAGGLLLAACALPAAPRQLLVASGQLFLHSDDGIYRLDPSQARVLPPQQQQQQQQQQQVRTAPRAQREFPAAAAPVVRFAQGSLVGAAASGPVQISGDTREILFVSLLLRGGAIVIDEYHPDGTQRDNRTFDLRQPGLDFNAPPTALVWDPPAQCLYAASPTGTLWALPRTGPPRRLAASNARISSFALDGAGRRLFLTDTRQGRVLLLDLRHPAAGLQAFADDTALAEPWSIVYDAASARLYLAERRRDTVLTLPAPPAPNRPLTVRWTEFIGGSYTFLRDYNFGEPVALAIHEQRLWIADRRAGLVFPVDLKTRNQFYPLSPP
ncbi:MAG: YncE family protein [Acidobacteriota bacterium]